MKDQMLIDKYNELGKAHAETVSQLAKKDEIIKKLERELGMMQLHFNHSPGCGSISSYSSCDCGFQDALKYIKRIKNE